MIILLSLLPLLASASPLTRASTLLNSSYVSPVFQQSLENIKQDSLASIHELLSRSDYPKTTWIGQNGFTAVAQWDQEHRTRTFYSAFAANESHYASNPGGCTNIGNAPLVDCFNDDAQWAALASLEGYAAYGDDIFLERAKGVHEFVSNHGFINDTVIAEGYLKGTHYANNTLRATCNGKSMYGGVYWQNGSPLASGAVGAAYAAANTSIDSGSTVLYALLSAKLCEITSDMWYCNRSYDALQFMDRFQINPTNGFVTGHIDGKTCAQPTSYVITSTTGNYIAAYTLLSNLTSNATALAIARKTLISALTTDIWNTEKGVLDNGHPSTGQSVVGLQSVLIRRLNFVYHYMDAEVQNAIRQYVNIQYWSLVNYDSNDATKPLLYAKSWNGPKYLPANVTGQSQIEAIDVINALVLNPQSAFPTVNSTDKAVITA